MTWKPNLNDMREELEDSVWKLEARENVKKRKHSTEDQTMNATDKYGAVMAGIAYAQLENHSSGEFIDLDSKQQSMIACDLLDATNDENDKCSTPEYLRRIGKGNLANYAKCLR